MKGLTLNKRVEIEYLVREGLGIREIARRANISHSTVIRELNRCHPYDAVTAHKHAEQVSAKMSEEMSLNLVKNKADFILEKIDKSIPITEIAKEIGCSRGAIKRFLSSRNIEIQTDTSLSYGDRIGALEQQVEILMDIIKEIGCQKS